MVKDKKKCIACCGKGFVLRKARGVITKKQKLKALELYQQGLSFRDICKKTGIKHPYSVQYVIRKINEII